METAEGVGDVMQADDVLIEIRDSSLVRVGQLAAGDLLEATFAPSLLGTGEWIVKVPHLIVDELTGRKVRNPKAVLLQQAGAGLVVTLPAGPFMSGPMFRADLSVDASFPGGVWTFTGVGDVETVFGSTVYGNPVSYSLTGQWAAADTKTDDAETLLYWYANRNRGAGAVVERQDARLLMGTNLGRGPVLKKTPTPFQPFPDLLAEVAREAYAADGTRLHVDAVQVDADLEFRVHVGEDRTSEIRFDFEHGLLDEVSYSKTAPDATEVIAGGEDGLRRRTLASNPWGVRRERFVSSSSSDTTELDQAADAVLAEAQEDTVRFSAVVADAQDRVPGVDYNLGDLVTVVVPGPTSDEEIPVPVTGVLVRLSPEGVMAGMVLGSPTGNTWQDLVSIRQQRMSARLNRLERK